MKEQQNNDFKNIQNHADIVEIIKSYIKLESHGKNYFGVCPFHDDHSPSMSVSPDKQIYKCFVCGATGNVFNFVENYLNVSFLEAVKIVAEKSGLKFTIHESKENQKYEKYYKIMELTALFYQNNLRTKYGREAVEYLHKRGLNDELIKEFGVGLALKDNNKLYELLSKKNIPKKDMDDLGLVATGEKGVYDLFRNRIIFPLKSPTGKINGFSGRIYNMESQSKYINTKETVIFKKRENLYNYNLAAPIAKQEKNMIVCEGFMDAIRVYSEGVKNIVATMGTALAKEQIQLLKKLNVTVTLVMDNDKAGEMATIALGEALIKEQIDVRVVRLTGKKDPDEYIIQYGIEAFKDNIKNAISYPEFMDIVLRRDKNFQNPNDITKYISEMKKMLNALNNDILTEVTISKIAEEFHISKDVIRGKKVIESPEPEIEYEEQFEPPMEIPLDIPMEIPPEIPKKQPVKKTNKFNKAFMTMLYYMMNDTDCMRLFLHYQLTLPKCRYRLVSNNLIYYFELNKKIDFADYLNFVSQYSDVEEVVKEIIEKVHISEFKEEDMESLIKTIKGIIEEEKIKQLKQEIKKELDSSRKKRLFEEIIEIKKGCVENGRD